MKQIPGEHLQDHWSSGFYFDRIRTLVAMATCSFHRLVWRKVEIGIFGCQAGDI